MEACVVLGKLPRDSTKEETSSLLKGSFQTRWEVVSALVCVHYDFVPQRKSGEETRHKISLRQQHSCSALRWMSDHHLAELVRETFLNVTEVGNERRWRNSFHRNFIIQSPHGAVTRSDGVRVSRVDVDLGVADREHAGSANMPQEVLCMECERNTRLDSVTTSSVWKHVQI